MVAAVTAAGVPLNLAEGVTAVVIAVTDPASSAVFFRKLQAGAVARVDYVITVFPAAAAYAGAVARAVAPNAPATFTSIVLVYASNRDPKIFASASVVAVSAVSPAALPPAAAPGTSASATGAAVGGAVAAALITVGAALAWRFAARRRAQALQSLAQGPFVFSRFSGLVASGRARGKNARSVAGAGADGLGTRNAEAGSTLLLVSPILAPAARQDSRARVQTPAQSPAHEPTKGSASPRGQQQQAPADKERKREREGKQRQRLAAAHAAAAQAAAAAAEVEAQLAATECKRSREHERAREASRFAAPPTSMMGGGMEGGLPPGAIVVAAAAAAAAAGAAADEDDRSMADGRRLRAGWRRCGPDAEGDIWYESDAGESAWEPTFADEAE